MRPRLAIAISGATAACVLAVGLSAAGFGPLPRSQADDTAGGLTSSTTIVDPATEPEVVYVKPAPEPQTVVVTKRATAQTEEKKARNRRTTREASHDDEDEQAEHRAERDDHDEHERDDD